MNKYESKNINKVIFLSIIGVVSLLFLGFTKFELIKQAELPEAAIMKQSVELTEKWFDIVCAEKLKRNIISDANSNVKYSGLIGNDYTYITTTLGSLEAKELATNPEFAAIITKYLISAGVDKSSTVGMTISGSFPSLAIATLASLQTIGAEVILCSSLGASSYGANQPEATWIDIENWLIKEGGLKYRTCVLTLGTEDDNGNGLQEEGLLILEEAAKRNNVELYIPATLKESIEMKTKLLSNNDISLLINIGGNQAAMGSCVHAPGIPNGLNNGDKICDDENRGIISRLAEDGIPYLHLLNIKDLAIKNNIPLEPGITYGSSKIIYSELTVSKIPAIIMLVIIFSLLIIYKRKVQF